MKDNMETFRMLPHRMRGIRQPSVSKQAAEPGQHEEAKVPPHLGQELSPCRIKWRFRLLSVLNPTSARKIAAEAEYEFMPKA
jgi:hypothetical protein